MKKLVYQSLQAVFDAPPQQHVIIFLYFWNSNACCLREENIKEENTENTKEATMTPQWSKDCSPTATKIFNKQKRVAPS